jgi:hypothetical protein
MGNKLFFFTHTVQPVFTAENAKDEKVSFSLVRELCDRSDKISPTTPIR